MDPLLLFLSLHKHVLLNCGLTVFLNQIDAAERCLGHYNCQVRPSVRLSSKLKNQLQYDILYIFGISRTKLSQ